MLVYEHIQTKKKGFFYRDNFIECPDYTSSFVKESTAATQQDSDQSLVRTNDNSANISKKIIFPSSSKRSLTPSEAGKIKAEFYNFRYPEKSPARSVDVRAATKKLINKKFHFNESPETESLVNDCYWIAGFLVDINKIKVHLAYINGKINDALMRDGVSIEKAPVHYLSRFISRELEKFGFLPYGKVFSILTPKEFRLALEELMLLKDNGVGETRHGEFAHLLQWLLICYEQESTRFLENSVPEVVRFLGSDASVLASFQTSQGIRELNIWDFVVDIFGEPYDNADFRQPERMMLFFKREESKMNFPNITTLLEKRFKKRTEIYQDMSKEQIDQDKSMRSKDLKPGYRVHDKVLNIHVATARNVRIGGGNSAALNRSRDLEDSLI